MKYGILGRKVGMTQVFDETGALIPVTVIDTRDCTITQVKTLDKEGYQAVQLAWGNRKPQNVNKARAGHFKKAGIAAKPHLKELRFADSVDLSTLKAGTPVNVGVFQKGDIVDVVGTSRGRGYTGVVKRFGFHGGDATHGVSDYFRHGGSNGANTCPGRVIKLKGMPGQMGNVQETAIGLRVQDVREGENLILVRGSVPGPKNGLVTVRPSSRKPLPTNRAFVKTA